MNEWISRDKKSRSLSDCGCLYSF